MLPSKVSDFLSSLRYKTEAGELQWNYDDENTEVVLDNNDFWVSIAYSFNTVEEVGQYRIVYLDKGTNKHYVFSTSEIYSDYEIARKLFDSAQASGLRFGF
jgi:hypothetical protein